MKHAEIYMCLWTVLAVTTFSLPTVSSAADTDPHELLTRLAEKNPIGMTAEELRQYFGDADGQSRPQSPFGTPVVTLTYRIETPAGQAQLEFHLRRDVVRRFEWLSAAEAERRRHEERAVYESGRRDAIPPLDLPLADALIEDRQASEGLIAGLTDAREIHAALWRTKFAGADVYTSVMRNIVAELGQFVRDYPETTSALTAKLICALHLGDTALNEAERRFVRGERKRLLREIITQHPANWQTTVAILHLAGHVSDPLPDDPSDPLPLVMRGALGRPSLAGRQPALAVLEEFVDHELADIPPDQPELTASG